ncbi:colicin import membrane protein [Polaromonas sp. OV174]|uniref:cell envelope integrity protein TolA n=1 Tax=Polaromonas sp. OV174 TaxID=1855300 RepID=UPI0008E85CFE|nr:cell envelope integrity protein TolA [Polaromonas sp. OV174]SFC11628.1 colicin import membrane protein [Polaromonas sp. OV174]
MPSAAERLEFAPPRDTGNLRAFGLALLAHVLLIAALTWGVNWKRSDQTVSFDAELWSSLPQQAAPKLIETPPPPPPPPVEAPTPTPRPAPTKVAPPEPALPDADIALQQEKKRKQLQKEAEAKAEEKARKLQEQLKAEQRAKIEKAKEKEQKAKEELAKRKAADEAKKAQAQKHDAEQQAQQKLTEAAAKKQRQDAMNRMMGLAGATGGADAKGSAQKSSGPSASYGGKVRAAVKPNVVFTEDIAGNPKAEVEVRTTADGTIMSQKLIKSSGNPAWDDAVIKAIIRTGTLPRDVDGRVPTPMILEFRPKDY